MKGNTVSQADQPETEGEQASKTARARGLYLVQPGGKDGRRTRGVPRPRSLGLLTLAVAALAAPLLWLAHALLHWMHLL